MKRKRIITSRRIICLVILFIMGLFVVGSDVYVQSVKQGITLYVVNVLPATFPFFFFSKLLTEMDFARDLAPLTEKPLCKLFNVGTVAGHVLIMSLLCGYPIGAKLLSDFFCSGIIDKPEAKKIMSFTSTGGPIFIIGTIGVAMFDNKIYGFVLLLSHYIGTFFNGLLYRGKKKPKKINPLPGVVGGDLLQKSMTESFLSVGVVGGFIVLFNLFIDMANNLQIINRFGFLLAYMKIPSRISEGFLCGLIEMTRGCKMLSSTPYPLYIILPCCCFLLTFGGFSITLQSMAYLGKIKISPGYYLLTKTTQGIFSAIICLVITLIFF